MMKNFLLLSIFLTIFIVAGCGENKGATIIPQKDHPTANKIRINADDKILVVYFSVPETTNPNNRTPDEENSTVVIDGKVFGNTQYLAYLIQENTKADIFRIEPVTPYPMNHAELEQIATQENQKETMPEIAEKIHNFRDYKIIFVGYPNWYGDMPRILYTFFDSYNFSGKTVIPFVTSGSKGFSNTINKIKELQPSAKVIEDGLSIKRDAASNAENSVKTWLKDLGF